MKKRKLVIVMRTDLGLGMGKMIAQAGHSVVQSIFPADNLFEAEVDKEWLVTGMKKVCLGVDSEDGLMQVIAKATEHGIRHTLVRDAGLTQVPAGTPTCVAVGPDADKQIEKVTGHLKLL